MTFDFLRYYDLETYLFDDVHDRFHRQGSLSAFNFFAIVVWKANRAKGLESEGKFGTDHYFFSRLTDTSTTGPRV